MAAKPPERSSAEQMAYEIGFQYGFTDEDRLRHWDRNKRVHERQVKTAPKPTFAWHDVLGVNPDADDATIQSAYRSLACKHHPDKGGVAALFMQIQEAFEEAKRQKKSP